MAAASGIVEAISFKEQAEDDYGNVFRCSVKLDDGEWYSFGGKKDERLSIKNGKDWHDVQVGDEIEFFYTENGKFKNAKSSKTTLVAAGEGAPRKSSGGGKSAGAAAGRQPAAAGKATAGSAGGKARSINPEYAIGRWVNGALALVQSGKAPDLKTGLLQAAALETWATTHFERILEEAKLIDPITGKKAAAPKAAPATPPPAEEPPEQEEAEEEAPPPPPKAPARRRAAPAPKAAPARQPPAEAEPENGDAEQWQDDEIPF